MPTNRKNKMKSLGIAALLLIAGSATAQTPAHVDGYLKKDGTYVQPHMKTTPDATKDNNYSSKGNVNPYTGKEGTVNAQPSNPYAVPQTPSYPTHQPNQPAQVDLWGNPKRK